MKLLLLITAEVVLACVAAHAQYIAEILPTPSGGGRAYAAGGGQIVGAAFGVGGGPVMWSGNPIAITNMMPAAFIGAELLAVGGGQQVGYARDAGGRNHALAWAGSANNYVDLDVPTYQGTSAWATDGIKQAGAGTVGPSIAHALLWSGTAQSVVDLHPAGYTHNSHAYGVSGDTQIGNVSDFVLPDGPAIWRGTAESFQLLPLPKGNSGGFAYAIHGDQGVGSASIGTGSEGVIWDTKNLTFTLVGPGVLHDTNGTAQVGLTGGLTAERATVWFGAPGTDLDLHQFVPTGIMASRALGIDENGTIVGWGETASGSVPIVWTPVPEPSTFITIGIGIGILALRKRKSS